MRLLALSGFLMLACAGCLSAGQQATKPAPMDVEVTLQVELHDCELAEHGTGLFEVTCSAFRREERPERYADAMEGWHPLVLERQSSGELSIVSGLAQETDMLVEGRPSGGTAVVRGEGGHLMAGEVVDSGMMLRVTINDYDETSGEGSLDVEFTWGDEDIVCYRRASDLAFRLGEPVRLERRDAE